MAFLPLLLLVGCGVTSIYVPVDRPAEIYLQRCSGILLHLHTHSSPGRMDMDAPEVLARIERSVLETFPSGLQKEITSTARIRTDLPTADDVPLVRYKNVMSETGMECLLQWHVLECRYDEHVQTAEIMQSSGEQSSKSVRKGILQLRVLVSAIDLREGRSFWRDTLIATESIESKASQTVPVDIDSISLLDRAAASLADEILRRATPRKERAVVSFLKDADYPDIVKGIQAAERGRWKSAITIFSGIAQSAKGRDGEDRMLHNLGMAQLYHGDFRAAFETFQSALQLKQDKRYELALQQVLDMERESQEREQQRRP